MNRVHKARSYASRFARANGVCASCDVKFHSRYRLMAHWKWNKRCGTMLELGAIPMLSAEEQLVEDRLEAAHRKECRHHGVHPSSGLPPGLASGPKKGQPVPRNWSSCRDQRSEYS